MALVGLALVAAPAQATAMCDLAAAPGGSDKAAGTPDAPYRTAQRLAGALAPGQTGCLRAGTYAESVTISRGGAAGAPVTLRSWPGERATVVGRMVVTKMARFVTVEELFLDGRNAAELPSPTVNGDDITFRRNDVTNHHTAICFVLGASDVDSTVDYGRAARTQLIGNRIHDCGKLPATNHDHGVYVEGTDDARLVGNWIHGNADRGIQLYPDAQGTEIAGNVLDGNGTNLIFSGDLGLAANGTRVSGNLITNAVLRFNVESWYPEGNPKGVGNAVTGNCLAGAKRTDAGPSGIDPSDGGFGASDNRAADPGYLNRAAGDYRIAASSPCAALFSGDRAAVPGPSVGAAAAWPAEPAPAPPTSAPAPPAVAPTSAPAAPGPIAAAPPAASAPTPAAAPQKSAKRPASKAATVNRARRAKRAARCPRKRPTAKRTRARAKKCGAHSRRVRTR